MSSMFWINTAQLDVDQRNAVEHVPDSSSFLIYGPAGSGKTNILLLRAKWMILKRFGDLKIVVFTNSLRDFVRVGCDHYGISPEVVVTQMSFFRAVLEEYSVSYELTNDFETDRSMLSGKLMSLIESKRISSDHCGAILVDEAQDYTDTELMVFRSLTKRLVFAADSRQSIYKVTQTPDLAKSLVDNYVITLRFHYRSGLKLCKVADSILSDSVAYPRVQTECRYPENVIPSSVTSVQCDSFDAQLQSIAQNLSNQLVLYPGEPIGVLFPKKDQAENFRNHYPTIPGSVSNLVRIDTLHAAKGWEFRAVHIGGCETLYRMGSVQKRLAYTGILRGKTSAHLYYTGHLPGYLENALAVLEPPRASPSMDQLFRGK